MLSYRYISENEKKNKQLTSTSVAVLKIKSYFSIYYWHGLPVCDCFCNWQINRLFSPQFLSNHLWSLFFCAQIHLLSPIVESVLDPSVASFHREYVILTFGELCQWNCISLLIPIQESLLWQNEPKHHEYKASFGSFVKKKLLRSPMKSKSNPSFY